MPKLKTKKGVKKRFKVTGSGKVKRSNANTGHLKLAKSQKRKRKCRRPELVHSSEEKTVKMLLPYN